MENPRCPRCGKSMWRQGFNYTKEGKFQRFKCSRCAFITSDPMDGKILQKLDTILKDKVIIK
jgi:transposase-like protein